MNVIEVDGMPISKLKANYIVIIVQDLREFEQVIIDKEEPVFIDKQKAYCISEKKCFVLFHNGRLDSLKKEFNERMNECGDKIEPQD